MDNLAEQCEEIEALNSIYENWKFDNVTNSYSIEVAPNVKLFITLTPNYPSEAPPNFELLAPNLNFAQKQHVEEGFRKIYEDNQRGPILYQWIEKLKEIINETNTTSENIQTEVVNNINTGMVVPKKELNLLITHGDTIHDRRSVFQGHATKVQSQNEIKAFIEYLMENKKIAQATHKISAYRILTERGTILQDCEDDGETHAGGRVLHLLQILNLTNVCVVVTRWYGGVHLGPDRFKHINNCARQVLVQAKIIPS